MRRVQELLYIAIALALVGIGGALSYIQYHYRTGPQKTRVMDGNHRLSLLHHTKHSKGDRLEEVTFYSQKDCCSKQYIKRQGVLVLRPKARAIVLVCHGYSCNKFDIGFVRFLFKNYHCMTFDFRAHGELREGQCCTFGRDEAFDVRAAVNYIKSRPELAHLPLIVYGFSMGAVASIEAQAQADKPLFNAMILDCPYERSEKVLQRGLERLKIRLFGYEWSIPGKRILQRYAFHPWIQPILKFLLKIIANMDATITDTRICLVTPEESVKKITAPCFFIYCINDDKISLEASTALFNGAAGIKRLWWTEGRRHFDSFFYNPEKYTYKVNRFIEKCLNGSLKKKKESARISKDMPLIKNTKQ